MLFLACRPIKCNKSTNVDEFLGLDKAVESVKMEKDDGITENAANRCRPLSVISTHLFCKFVQMKICSALRQ